MKRKNCEYCGTEYQDNLPQCPLCGKAAGAENAETGKDRKSGKYGGARVAPKGSRKAKKQRSEDRIPQWMWAVICVVLALAVLIGLAYFLISMGYIGEKKKTTDIPQTSVTVPEVDPVNEPELLQPMPEEIQVPEDLSCTALMLSQTGLVFDVKGSSVFLTAIPTPVETTDPVFFVSGDETIATVDANGMITAVGRGQTEVTVSCGDVAETCIVVCDFQEEEPEEQEKTEETEDPKPEQETEQEPEEVLQPKLSTEDFTLFRPGEETTLRVKDAPDGAYITYSSSNSDVVTVSSSGQVKAVGNGTATITVMVNDVKLTCVARCNLGTTAENAGGDTGTAVSGTLILQNPYNPGSHTSDITLKVGESVTMSLVDQNGNKAGNVNWTTSNGGVVTVTNGKITRIGTGTVEISAIYGGKSYTCTVR